MRLERPAPARVLDRLSPVVWLETFDQDRAGTYRYYYTGPALATADGRLQSVNDAWISWAPAEPVEVLDVEVVYRLGTGALEPPRRGVELGAYLRGRWNGTEVVAAAPGPNAIMAWPYLKTGVDEQGQSSARAGILHRVNGAWNAIAETTAEDVGDLDNLEVRLAWIGDEISSELRHDDGEVVLRLAWTPPAVYANASRTPGDVWLEGYFTTLDQVSILDRARPVAAGHVERAAPARIVR